MDAQLLAYLRTFVSFRTTTAEPKVQCLHWIERAFFSKTSVRVERGDIDGAPYLLLRHPHPSLLWFAHIDVVPGRDDQFEVRIEGDNAIGRGTKDMKGAALSFLMAYAEACERGEVPPVSILLTSDEETGGQTPPALLDQDLFTDIPVAFTPDIGAHQHIVTELKGAAWLQLTAQGKSGHGALPWESENPVPRLCQVILDLQKAFPPGENDDWQMTVTPTKLFGSSAYNRIPFDVACAFDVRFPPEICSTAEEALEIVRKHVPPDCTLELIEKAAPLKMDSSHPMVSLMKRLAEEVTGGPVDIGREHGSSDARSFCARGIPAFLYGPVGGDLHGEHEWVSIKSLEQHVELNRRLLEELSKDGE